MADDDDDEGGYRKPPKRHQFKKGESGNPTGRARKAPMPISAIDKVLKRKISVTIDGKQKKVSVVEAAVITLAKNALDGSPTAIRELVRLETIRSKTRAEEAEDPDTFTLTIQDPGDSRLLRALTILGIVTPGDSRARKLEPWAIDAAMSSLRRPLTEHELKYLRQVLGKDAWF